MYDQFVQFHVWKQKKMRLKKNWLFRIKCTIKMGSLESFEEKYMINSINLINNITNFRILQLEFGKRKNDV